MRPQSAKAKGRLFQQYIRDRLLERAPHLTENDIRSTSMGASGVDIQLSEAALKTYPFAIECKAQESLNIWTALEQAKENADNLTPLLCFKRNRTDAYVALPLNRFLDLISRHPTDVSKNPEKIDMTAKIDELIRLLKGVKK